MVIDFEKQVSYMQDMGYTFSPAVIHIQVPDAKNLLWRGIQYFCKDAAKWQPEYEEVAQWLADNKGRGLLCLGTCGRGKSLICSKILPLLLNYYYQLNLSIYDAQTMNSKPDEILSRRLLLIDDLGTENVSVKYGEKRMVFPELADATEKQGKLLIVTTNLSLRELADKYGQRTIDRLRATTKAILFQGESMRE